MRIFIPSEALVHCALKLGWTGPGNPVRLARSLFFIVDLEDYHRQIFLDRLDGFWVQHGAIATAKFEV